MNMPIESHESILQKQHMNEHVSIQCYNVALSLHGDISMQILDVADFEILTVLGRGSFSEVLLVQEKKQNAGVPRQELALKRLSQNAIENSQTFIRGATDLILEAKLLANLNHKHIIRLHGVSSHDDELKSCYTSGNRYCLFLDRLYGTVEETFNSLRSRKNPYMTSQDVLQNLIHIAFPISTALAYLHSLKIIFRDLKPTNMGFDSKGILKLFDFGLARRLPSETCQHQMTGRTGSRRYMAPEVALSQNYGLSADTYSFGVFLFECLTLAVPFDGMSIADHQQCVVRHRFRPSFPVPCHVPRSVQKLVKKCWNHSPQHRPEMDRVQEVLTQVIVTYDTDKELQKGTKYFQRSNRNLHHPSQTTFEFLTLLFP